MVKEKKKGESGAATSYISRKQAMRRLNLTLKDFRRLCILKGIYPHEPKNKKKASGGNTAVKTFYYLKDIQFLSHEPIVHKLRQLKIFMKKAARALGRRERTQYNRLQKNKPDYKVDHIVKERYPTFVDALRDLDDAISMCFLFSSFPKFKGTDVKLIHLCRRLTIEFLHYVIEARALRKCFISIKGFYYQAEIENQLITWVVPHQFGFDNPKDVDFKVMLTFTEFYTTLLGFVNYKLYHKINLNYPPKMSKQYQKELTQMGELADERIVALTQSLNRIHSQEDEVEEEEKMDEFLISEDPDQIQRLKIEQDKIKKQQKLFEGFKFFLNREIPREAFTFAIRSVGGQVSWDKTLCPGATIAEDDKTITHQLVDRPKVEKQFMNRYYIQPQWVFDCINARRVLPPEKYFPGENLPPHLSPFVEEGEDDYVPPERKEMMRLEAEEDGMDVIEDEEEEIDSEEEGKKKKKRPKPKFIRDLEELNEKSRRLKSRVQPGKIENIDEEAILKKQEEEEKKLAVMTLSKRKRKLYERIVDIKKKKARNVTVLHEKRRSFDRAQRKKNTVTN